MSNAITSLICGTVLHVAGISDVKASDWLEMQSEREMDTFIRQSCLFLTSFYRLLV